jgi:carboxyl-terminal processing protease
MRHYLRTEGQSPSTGKDMKFKVTRRAIQMPQCPIMAYSPTSWIYLLNGFTEGLWQGFPQCIIEKRRRHPGLCSTCAATSELEMEAVNVSTASCQGQARGEQPSKLKEATATTRRTVEPIDTVMPSVLLVNGGTAWSAEIVSGACRTSTGR